MTESRPLGSGSDSRSVRIGRVIVICSMMIPEIIYKGIGNASRAPIESMLDRAYHPTMCESHVL